MRRRTLLTAAIISGCAIDSGCSGMGSASGGSGVSEGATDSQQAAIKQMEVATGNAWSVSYDTLLGTPYHAAGSTAPLLRGQSATQAALAALAASVPVLAAGALSDAIGVSPVMALVAVITGAIAIANLRQPREKASRVRTPAA